MTVIANSGPIIALGKLGLLDLLHRLYGQVRLTTAVYEEVALRGGEEGYPEAFLVQMAIQKGQMVVVNISDADLPPEIASLPLDAGEKQTLYLALRDKANLVLVDDLKAREEMQAHGLTVKGTLGVIVAAYRAGFLQLDEVQTIFEAIIARDDIWIAKELCRQVLARLKAEKCRGA